MRFLVCDIGNTQIKLGIYDDEKLIANWRITTNISKTTDELGIELMALLTLKQIPEESIDTVAISCVVPGILHSFQNAIVRYLHREPLLVGPGVKSGVRIKTVNPKELGADIICDVAAALCDFEGPLMVVDFGTVTKFEIVNEQGEFIAAVFAPGIGISSKAMSEKAAQLPYIEIKRPDKIITSVTSECMQVGVVYGYIGQVRYLIERIKKEMNKPHMKVVATGGYSQVFGDELSDVIDRYDPQLTLRGLRLIAEKNLKKTGKK